MKLTFKQPDLSSRLLTKSSLFMEHTFTLWDSNLKFEVLASELVRNGGNVCQDFHNENCTHVVVDDSKSPNIANDVSIHLAFVLNITVFYIIFEWFNKPLEPKSN